jgi:EmrB/QacA subfamily drug resistance transporter
MDDKTVTVTRPPQVTAAAYPRRWAAALVMMIAALMDLIDVTIVNVALPTIRRDLHASGTQLEWVISAYLLAFAVTLITAGRLGDLLGRKKLFLAGVAGFGLASLACALAPDAGVLIAARAVQGAAAAVMVPQVLATYRAIFTGKERGAAFGMYGAAGGLAAALGLLLGGLLVSANIFGWHWRAVFAVNIPIAAATLITAAVLVPETRQAAAQRPDYLGLGLLCAALVAIVYPLLEGQALGWPAWTFLLIAAGVLLVTALAIAGPRLTPRRAAPILPPGLLARPAFTAGIAVQLLFFLGLQGLFVVLALWLQAGFGYSPIKAGATAATFSLGAAITAGLSVPLATRLGRYILIAGALLMAAGTYGLLLAAQHAAHGVSPWQLAPGLIVAGAGLGLLVVPLANVVLAAVPPGLAGGASGVFTTAQQLGGAAGVALAGTIFFPRITTEGFTSAFQATMPLVIGAFLGCALLSLALPRTAVADAYQ